MTTTAEGLPAYAAQFGDATLAVLNVLRETGTWHFAGSLRYETSQRGHRMTSDNVNDALSTLLGAAPVWEPQLIVRREVEKDDRPWIKAYCNARGIAVGAPQWLYAYRKASA